MHRSAPKNEAEQLAIAGRLLLEPGWFSHERVADLRGRTALAMSLFVAPASRCLPKIRMRHWCEGGRDVMDAGPDEHYQAQNRLSKGRFVAVVPTLKTLGGAYVAASGGRGKNDLFFQSRDGGATDKTTFSSALETACRHIGAPGALTHGDAALLLRRRLLSASQDGLAEYILGIFRSTRPDRCWSMDRPPSDALMLRFIVENMPFATPPEDLLAKVKRSWPGGRLPDGNGVASLRREPPETPSDAVRAAMRTCLEPGWCSDLPQLDARGGFALALARLAGIGPARLPLMRREHWRPSGADVVVVQDHAGSTRRVPLACALRFLGERYLSLAPAGPPDAPLLVSSDGIGVVRAVLSQALAQACAHAGVDRFGFDDALAAFRHDVLSADRDDGLPEHLVGMKPPVNDAVLFDAARPPPDATAAGFLAARLPDGRCWDGLRHDVPRRWAAGRRRRS